MENFNALLGYSSASITVPSWVSSLHAVVPPVCLLSCTTTCLRGVGLCLNVRGDKSPRSRHQCLVSESESHVRTNFGKKQFFEAGKKNFVSKKQALRKHGSLTAQRPCQTQPSAFKAFNSRDYSLLWSVSLLNKNTYILSFDGGSMLFPGVEPHSSPVCAEASCTKIVFCFQKS